jgi:hypothetical protein
MVTGLPRMRSCSVFSLWQDLVGAAVGVHCVLMEEDVHALLEICVHECSRGGVACCRNWCEAGHVLTELGDEVRWIHWVGCQSE